MQIGSIASGVESLDVLTRAFIRDQLAFRFAELPTFAEALKLERQIQRGEFPEGPPFLNPAPAANHQLALVRQ